MGVEATYVQKQKPTLRVDPVRADEVVRHKARRSTCLSADIEVVSNTTAIFIGI